MLGRLSKLTLGIVCASAGGRTVYANPMIEHMVGPVPTGVPGRQWALRFGLAHPDGEPYREPYEIPLLRAQKDGDSTGKMLSRDGRGATLLRTITVPVSDASGRCLGSVGVFCPLGPGHPRAIHRRVRTNPEAEADPGVTDSERLALFLAALELSDRVVHQLDLPLAQRALSLVRARYAEGWTLSGLAEELCVTPGHLTTTVATHTGGGGLMHQLAQVRVEAAKRLLLDTDETVETVGRRVGFPDRQRFLRTFRRHTGRSPGHYRMITRQSDTDLRGIALPDTRGRF